jgi:hypothetical protein
MLLEHPDGQLVSFVVTFACVTFDGALKLEVFAFQCCYDVLSFCYLLMAFDVLRFQVFL